MNIVYMGTPDFAVPPLKAIIENGHNVIGVFTQPDKPKGRGYVLTPPPVKKCAMEYNIPVYQLVSMKNGEALEILKQLSPDIIVVTAYGKILPKDVLELPKYGCINIHASLLPKYRGAGPIQWCVLNGEEKTGITVMQMSEGLDTGDMLFKAETKIGENETASELHDRLSMLGAEIVIEALDKIEKGEVSPQKQDDTISSYAPMLNKSLCEIDWNKSAQEIHNQVRGLNSWPIAVSKINGKRVKIFTTRILNKSGKAGSVISTKPLIVACGNGAVEIFELQQEGKKRMKAENFVLGSRIDENSIFG